MRCTRLLLVPALSCALAVAVAAPAAAANSVSVKGPGAVKRGKPAPLRVSGHADAMALLRVRFAAPGKSCPRSLPDTAAGTFQRVLFGAGPISFRFSHRFSRRGTWRACAYLSTTGKMLARSSARIRVR